MTEGPLADLAREQAAQQRERTEQVMENAGYQPPQQTPTPNPANAMPQQAPVQDDFLGNLGLSDVPEGIRNGKYPAVLAYGSAGTYESKDTHETLKRVSFAWRIDWPGNEFHNELIENDFCHSNPGMDNKAKRKLRDRLVALGLPLGGVSTEQLNNLIQGKKGAPVWIEVYTDKRKFVNVTEISTRDTALTAQMQQGAAQIQADLRDVATPTGMGNAGQAVSRDY